MIYKVISAENLEELETEVNECLVDGWMCLGGVAVYGHEKSPRYYQAMTNHTMSFLNSGEGK